MENIPIPCEWKVKLRNWLKSGSVIISSDNVSTMFEESSSGALQRGILCPLLMNVLLNGMEELMLSTVIKVSKKSKKLVIRKRNMKITSGIKYSQIGDCRKIKYQDRVPLPYQDTHIFSAISHK